MRHKLLPLILVASLAGNVAFAVTAYVARQKPPATLASDQLGLDQNQRARLAPLQESFAAERNRARSRVSELTVPYAEQFARAEPDRARVEQLAAEMAAIQTEMRLRFMRFLLDLHALLRPDQRGVLSDILRNKGAPEGASAPCCPGASLCPTHGTPDGAVTGDCSSAPDPKCTPQSPTE